MPCYYPWTGYKTASGEVIFSERGDVVSTLSLPCGKCIGCRLDKAQEWAVRCLHESKLHRENAFVTLTYSPEHLPADGSVSVREVQLFMKRLRERIAPIRVRYFAVGEYGGQLLRPHYHILLFGWMPSDRKVWRTTKRGDTVWRSEFLESIWAKGFSEVGLVTQQSAGYCARYALKKVYGDKAKEHYARLHPDTGELVMLRPEFAVMSRKPGIGYEWMQKYVTDYFPHGSCIVNGKEVKAPRYYVEKWGKENPEELEVLKTVRGAEAKLRYEDNTDERLRVKAVVKEAQVLSLKRTMENG